MHLRGCGARRVRRIAASDRRAGNDAAKLVVLPRAVPLPQTLRWRQPEWVISVNGALYGTTQNGGRYKAGTVFSVTTTGKKGDLYSFRRSVTGKTPHASLTFVQGILYGTTQFGHKACGTVFSVATAGIQTVYVFRCFQDAEYPYAGLTDVRGTLYGTTAYGGSRGECSSGYNRGCGSVFSVTTTGKCNFLYGFRGQSDGAFPQATLINVNGTLYGTTSYGGGSGCYGPGCGTVFSVTTTGREKVLHRFAGGPDGAFPSASLIDVRGTLYGTTDYGGVKAHGTVFSVTTSGTEKVLHSFAGGSDGAAPVAGLINVEGTLYGTTSSGGSSNDGTVYSIRASGTEKVLYSFGGGTDGADPVAGLTNVYGTLYGTTFYGGGTRCTPRGSGCGTFSR